jgi:TRAP-type C4-dicarboxylate transport system permease small subunit
VTDLEKFRVVAGSALLFLGGWGIMANAVCSWAARRGKWKGTLIPFVGGIFGCLGLLAVPWKSVRLYWWVPLVADVGGVPMAVAVLIDAVRRKTGKAGAKAENGPAESEKEE